MPESQDGLFMGFMVGSIVVMFAAVIYLPFQYSFIGIGAGVAVMMGGMFGSEAITKYAASGFPCLKPEEEPMHKVRSIFLLKGEPNSYPVLWWDPKAQRAVDRSTSDDGTELAPVEWETEH